MWVASKPDKAKLRSDRRKAYLPAEFPSFDLPRSVCPLDGDWLFLPDQELSPSEAPQTEVFDDAQWHVMEVPHFWTPTLSWLHDETGFPKLHGISSSKGLCDKLYEAEMRRLDGYTFDWTTTKGAWYRHYLMLPASISNRRFELCFDAIAKVADIWLNGIHVGSHIGMFGEIRCDISHAVKRGKNLLAVHAVGHPRSRARIELDEPFFGEAGEELPHEKGIAPASLVHQLSERPHLVASTTQGVAQELVDIVD